MAEVSKHCCPALFPLLSAFETIRRADLYALLLHERY